VDHSYQTLEDPWDRITKAFALNIDLLKSFTITYIVIKRMQCNLDLLTDGVFSKALKHFKGTINDYPQ
jgi:hypothetical protein